MLNLKEFRSTELPDEDRIISTWEGQINSPIISILCHTYNHRDYIEDALRGFLTQKTTFPFEVILHDDASTDGTTEIIKEYEERYPRILKPVIQKNNKYSKGVKPTLLSFPHAKGNYIAMCEGDDFWFSDDKLQKQFDLATKNPNIYIFFHPSILFIKNKNKGIINDYGHQEKVIETSALIKKGGGVMPTASLMIHRSIFENLPEWFRAAPVGDYYFQVIASKNGAFYSCNPDSVYRLGTAHSVSKSHREKKGGELKKYFISEIYSLNQLNEFLEKKYESDIRYFQSVVAQNCAVLSLSQKDFSEYSRYIEESWSFYKRRTRSQYLLNLLREKPKLAWILVKIRNVLTKKN
ncbi:MAG TPA: glycosyltransferase family 2 protein [Alphaproteobacteria bacterium]|jgi:glycosyltransferase involved in cell wall biosynthesis|nr:glycosyltransferase family 2 protein [Alphaproteobacteria bacterium]